jgi:putative molybdopterin biosynthesis protein
MKQTESIDSIEAAKVLGDSRRLRILRLLMRGPATLSQLGKELNAHPAKVRHHLKLLEDAGYIELISTNIVRGFVEKYYQATSRAYIVNVSILPESGGAGFVVMMGSHDLAMEILSDALHDRGIVNDFFCISVGSLDGLIALRQGHSQMAGCHLSERSGHDFNVSHVEHIFPGKRMALIAVGYRQQGILTRQGNPENINELSDLAREDVTIVNRQPGSGTRLWFDQHLSDIGVSSKHISGYELEVKTHHQVAQAITRGKADAGIGLLAEAKMMNLNFSPLFEERYDLVLPVEELSDPKIVRLFDHINSAGFRRQVSRLGGYNTEHTGKMITVGN